MKKIALSVLIILIMVFALFGCSNENPDPIVVSSNPANGETGVSPGITMMTITLDRDMATGYSFSSNLQNRHNFQWTDPRNFQFEFDPLEPDQIYTVTLNPTG
jgi:hypothetical protein